MSSGSRTGVLAAITGNALLTVLKFGAAVVGHSASMMNEAVHSLVDTLKRQIRQRYPQVSHVTIEVQGIAADDSHMTQSTTVIGGPAIEI